MNQLVEMDFVSQLSNLGAQFLIWPRASTAPSVLSAADQRDACNY